MHEIKIQEAVIERAIERRGRLRLFDSIDPKRTAHLIIDMQIGFLTPGTPAAVLNAVEIIPNVNAISAACREAGALNVFFLNTISEESKASWSNNYAAFWTSEKRDGMYANFFDGNPNHDLHPSIETDGTDVRMKKYRFGAFVDGSSDIHQFLTARNIDTVIISGTLSNVCCDSTARDAMMLNYKVFFVADATATNTDEEHNATLGNMLLTFADVVSSDDVTNLLKA